MSSPLRSRSGREIAHAVSRQLTEGTAFHASGYPLCMERRALELPLAFPRKGRTSVPPRHLEPAHIRDGFAMLAAVNPRGILVRAVVIVAVLASGLAGTAEA